MDCKHVWLHMLRVDKNTTKIVCKECKQVMGFFEEKEIREPNLIRSGMKSSINDNYVDLPSVAEFLDELMNEAQNIQSGINGKVRELTDEECEELR